MALFCNLFIERLSYNTLQSGSYCTLHYKIIKLIPNDTLLKTVSTDMLIVDNNITDAELRGIEGSRDERRRRNAFRT